MHPTVGDPEPPTSRRLATDEVPLDGVPGALERILDGGARGRTLVRVS